MRLPGIVLITGTDTGVGKTVTTAALSVVLRRRGRTVAVYKPCQTGSIQGDSDIREVERLAGHVTVEAGVVLNEPLAPRPAAEHDAVALPSVAEHAQRIADLGASHDHVLVEGAGGLLVELDETGATLADLARTLEDAGEERVGFLVVTRAALGTLNHTALTLEALKVRGLDVLGLVLGSRPPLPGDAERGNIKAFARGHVPLVGALPENASLLPPKLFRDQALLWLTGVRAA